MPMQNNIIFSLIIPCYNASSYINKCITKVSQQTFNHNLFEVICVDDCSSDETYNLLLDAKQNSDLNLKVFRNENNIGPGLTRRFAAEKAIGNYLCFCDSDDWLENNAFCELFNVINEFTPDVIIFGMSYVLNGNSINQNLTSDFISSSKESYIANCGESLCNMCVNKELFLKIPPIDIRHGEDLALVPLILLNASTISHIDIPLYNYYLRSGSVSLGVLKPEAYMQMIQAFTHVENNIIINNKIKHIVEYIGIKTVLYSSTLMAIKGKNNNTVLENIVNNFQINYPLWASNSYLSKLKLHKRIYLKAIKYKQWYLLKIYSWLHQYILN